MLVTESQWDKELAWTKENVSGKNGYKKKKKRKTNAKK